MKKLFLVSLFVFGIGCNVFGCRHYMKMSFLGCACYQSRADFSGGGLGGKLGVGFVSYLNYFEMHGTFEMCALSAKENPVIKQKDWCAGVQLGVNPFARYDYNYLVHFNLMSEIGYMNTNRIYNSYGGRVEFGVLGGVIYAQYMYGFSNDFRGGYDWGSKVEVGIRFSFDVGKGRMY